MDIDSALNPAMDRETGLRVLMVSALFPPDDFGGAPIQSLHLAKALARRGVHVEFLTDNGPRASIEESYQGIAVTRLSTFFADTRSKWRELVFSARIFLFILSRSDLAMIHFHSIRGTEALLFPFLRVLGRRVLLKLTLAESDDPLTFRRRRLLGPAYFLGLKSAHRMAAISHQLLERSRQAGVPEGTVRLIYNGVNVEKFSPVSPEEKARMRRMLLPDCSGPVLLSIGKIEHRKGYDLLLLAYEKILKVHCDASLFIIGPGNDSANAFYRDLQEFIAARHWPNVHFLGKRENVDQYLKAADCFVFCSRQEGFGTVLIEAMACGIPTVAMDIPGVTSDIIQDGRIGKIAKAECPADIAEAVVSLLAQQGDAGVLEASTGVRLRFSIDKIAEQYLAVYREMRATG